MSQQTLVLTLAPAAGEALRTRLAAEPFEFQRVPHAAFSAKGGGVVVTLYRSGKLVVQGAAPDLFVARYVPAGARAPAGARRAPSAPVARAVEPAEPVVGSDETGKGDYFGPLVVAAVRLEPEVARELAGAVKLRDSKTLSDAEAAEIGALLRARVPFAIARLDPPEYNALHARVKNLNPMLADLHTRAIAALARPGMRVVVDQFANERLLVERTRSLDIRLEQHPRAEAEPAVAAASILARQEFLAALAELSGAYGMLLHKGAGAPTERAARAFVRTFGAAELEKVAKVHFKTTDKIGARR